MRSDVEFAHPRLTAGAAHCPAAIHPTMTRPGANSTPGGVVRTEVRTRSEPETAAQNLTFVPAAFVRTSVELTQIFILTAWPTGVLGFVPDVTVPVIL